MLSTKSGDHIANVVKAKKVVKKIYLNDVNKDDNEVNNDDSIIPKSFFTILEPFLTTPIRSPDLVESIFICYYIIYRN